MATDWLKLYNEYLDSPEGLRTLAQRHRISYSSMGRYAAKHQWAKEKQAYLRLQRALPDGFGDCSFPLEGERQTSAPVPVLPQADRPAQLLAIGDRLLVQMAKAAGELDKQVLTHKRKTRELVYNEAQTGRKPTTEEVREDCELEIVQSLVDRGGLQKLSVALKSLREVLLSGSGSEQSLTMVAELMEKMDAAARQEGD